MKSLNYIILLAVAVVITACTTSKKETVMLKQSDFPAPPVAEVLPDTFTNFGQTRIDNYYWLIPTPLWHRQKRCSKPFTTKFSAA